MLITFTIILRIWEIYSEIFIYFNLTFKTRNFIIVIITRQTFFQLSEGLVSRVPVKYLMKYWTFTGIFGNFISSIEWSAFVHCANYDKNPVK